MRRTTLRVGVVLGALGAVAVGRPAGLCAQVASGRVHVKLQWQSQRSQGSQTLQRSGLCEVTTRFLNYTTETQTQSYQETELSDASGMGPGQVPMHIRTVIFTYSKGWQPQTGLDASNHMWVRMVANGSPATTGAAPSNLVLSGGANLFGWTNANYAIPVTVRILTTNTFADGRVTQTTPRVYAAWAKCGVLVGNPQHKVQQPVGSTGPQPQRTPQDLYVDGRFDGQAWADWDLRQFFAQFANP